MTDITLEQPLRARLSAEGNDMKSAVFYPGTADAMGVPLYLYPDGSLTNSLRGVEPPPQRSSLTSAGSPPTIMVSVSEDGVVND